MARRAPRALEREKLQGASQERQPGRSSQWENSTIFFGHARLPQSLSLPSSPTVITVEIEVDVDSGRVVDVATNGLTTMAQCLLRSLLCERKLAEDLPQALGEFRRRYFGIPQKAICTALLNAYATYKRSTRQDVSLLDDRGHPPSLEL